MREIIAYHVIMGFHGFWLPNDPRGSGSTDVRFKPLQQFGPPTRVESRYSLADQLHDHNRRLAAKKVLRYPPIKLSGIQALTISQGFSRQITASGYVVWACAILPDHVHLVIRHHRYDIEQVVRLLKQAGTRSLLESGRHPFELQRLPSGYLPSVWQQDFRKVFLYSTKDIRQRIQYVNDNPMQAGLKPQHWSFVTPFTDN